MREFASICEVGNRSPKTGKRSTRESMDFGGAGIEPWMEALQI